MADKVIDARIETKFNQQSKPRQDDIVAWLPSFRSGFSGLVRSRACQDLVFRSVYLGADDTLGEIRCGAGGCGRRVGRVQIESKPMLGMFLHDIRRQVVPEAV